jgi:RNA polymerase sigma factor (sigma-70 family)
MADSTPLDAPIGQNLRPVAAPASRADLRRELETLYGSHFGKVAGYFRRCGQDDAGAQELAQETFVNALKGLDSFNGQSKLSTWLWSIARNVLLGHLRQQRPEGALDGDGEPVDPDTLMSTDDSHLRGMCDCVRRGFAAFAAEHPDRAQVIYLAVVEGWTRDELAAHLGRTVHAATEYLSQCKARLKPFIEHCHGD